MSKPTYFYWVKAKAGQHQLDGFPRLRDSFLCISKNLGVFLDEFFNGNTGESVV